MTTKEFEKIKEQFRKANELFWQIEGVNRSRQTLVEIHSALHQGPQHVRIEVLGGNGYTHNFFITNKEFLFHRFLKEFIGLVSSCAEEANERWENL